MGCKYLLAMLIAVHGVVNTAVSDELGEPHGAAIRISEPSTNRSHQLEVGADNRIAVTYTAGSTGYTYLQGVVRLFGANNEVILPRTILSVGSATTTIVTKTDVAIGDDLGMTVIWGQEDVQSGKAGVYVQRFSPTGIAIGEPHQLADEKSISSMLFLSIAATGNGGYVAAWNGVSSSGSEIFFSLFNAVSGIWSTPKMATDAISEEGNEYLDVSVIAVKDGGFFLVWHELSNGPPPEVILLDNVIMRSFDAVGAPRSLAKRVNETKLEDQPFLTVAASDETIIVGWDTLPRISHRVFTLSGEPLGAETKAPSNATLPAYVEREGDGWFSVWRTHNESNRMIDLRAVDHVGSWLGESQTLASVTVPDRLHGPNIKRMHDAGYVVSWIEGNNTSDIVHIQRYKQPIDVTPDAFTFGSVDGIQRGAYATSQAVTITGINAETEVRVTNGEYSDGCNGVFTAIPSVTSAGRTVCVRHLHHNYDETLTTTLTVGMASAQFVSKSEAAPAPAGDGGGGGSMHWLMLLFFPALRHVNRVRMIN